MLFILPEDALIDIVLFAVDCATVKTQIFSVPVGEAGGDDPRGTY